MTSIRGVMIGGITNRCRTQMAEGFIRALTGNSFFVCSGGIRMEESVLNPLAVEVMSEVHVDISQHVVTSLAHVRKHVATFDAMISIDSAPEGKSSSSAPQWATGDLSAAGYNGEVETTDGRSLTSIRHRPADVHTIEASDDVSYDAMLVPSTPSHWTVGHDATDVREKWQVWSPRNPMIAHERSTRKFQDHNYAGEPLFRLMEEDDYSRNKLRRREQWLIQDVSRPFPMERTFDHKARVKRVRDVLLRRCLLFVESLEEEHGIPLLDHGKLADIRRLQQGQSGQEQEHNASANS